MARWLALLWVGVLATEAGAADASDAEAGGGGFAPMPAGPRVHARVDFRAGWNLTDGTGMIDHIGMEVIGGPQLGDASPGRAAFAPLLGAGAGIAEEGQPSLRVFGGAEVSVGLMRALELVPSAFGGYLKAWKGDKRQGPMARVALGLRLQSDEDFYLMFEPLSLVVLPPPDGGFTRYTTHVSLDVGIVRFGGRTP